MSTISATPAHEFVTPGQVSPDLPPPDACVECGQSRGTHHSATYVEQATAADEQLDEQLAMLRAEEQAGEISLAEGAHERVRAMETHLDVIRSLRARHFGRGDDGQ